ncbi:MAG: hypothetical protein OEY23_16590, partial [Acidimicrobiia bacterium]|nr:hypothetical protein [Acidimicrobiia bacterium]
MLRRLAIRPKLFLVVAVPIVALLVAMGFSLSTLNRVKIHGPQYQKIEALNEVVQAVEPPSQYLAKSYAEVLHLVAVTDTNEQFRIIEELEDLESRYMENHDEWARKLEPGETRTLLVETSYVPAAEFWNLVDTQLVPAVQAGDRERAAALASGEIAAAFGEHEAAITQLGTLAKEQRDALEQDAR